MPKPQWFQKAKPTCSIVPLRRFVTESIFALKNDGYGCMFALSGIDDEGLTDEAVEDVVRRIQGALKGFPEHGRLYQYVRIRNGYDIPRQARYSNPRVDGAMSDRIAFLNETANFRKIELVWVATVEPPKQGSFSSKPLSPEQFRRQTTRCIAQLERTAEMLEAQLGELLNLRLLHADDAVSFWAYLVNLEPWALEIKLACPERVDKHIVRSSIQWTDEHLRIGRQYARFFSLLDSPSGSRPNQFAAFQSINANVILCSQWAPRSRSDVQKRVGQLEGFAGIFRHRLLAVAANMRNPGNLEKSVRAKAADKGSDKLAEVLDSIDNEGHDFGEYSFFGLVHSHDEQEVLEAMPLVHKALVDIQAPAIEETQGALSAYYAMLPGNSTGDAASNFNVRTSWLRADHNARLALAFAPSIGSVYSEDLSNEYLAVYETRTKTPYFLDPYTEGMRTTLIVGAPRSGKSVNGNNIILHEQKYGGFTFVIDVGGSYESTIRLFDGVVEGIGTSGPRINPFSLEPSESNLSFLFQFIRLLLVKGGASLAPEDEDAVDKSVRRMYLLPPAVRRLKNMALAPHLQRYLTKWTEGGVYGRVFDNVEDSLRLARIQSFDFQDVSENEQDLIEPMLFWILRQINQVIYDPANLAFPKHILFDELWKHLKTRTLLESAINSLKTGGKHLAGVTLLTQAAQDLGEMSAIIVNACTTQLFLPDRTFDRALYQRLFNLNDQEIENIASLAPREFMLKRAGFSKVLKLNLDPRSYWLFSTKPKDRQRRAQEIAEHGYNRAFEMQGA